MATYTFYPRQPDGSALTFESRDEPDDKRALEQARGILSQHSSCAFVSVWAGDRHIGDVRAPALSDSPA